MNASQKITCSQDGCDVRAKARGLCSLHYSKWRRGTLGKPPRKPIEGCKVDGCDAEHSARGFCATHYWQHMQGRPIGTKRRAKGCTREGCDRPHYSLGFCRPHYDQDRWSKRIAADPKPRRKVNKTVKKPTTPPPSKLPAGWDKTKPPKPKNAPKTTNLPEIGVVAPTEPVILDAARRVVVASGAADLLEMLGLVA